MKTPRIRQPSIRLLLLSAIGLLLVVIMVIGTIALMTLNSAEERLATFHDQTLNEVSDALELSGNASKLATSAPFLMTLSPSFQLESEAEEILQTLEHIQQLGGGDPELARPLARIRAAIDDLVRVMAPQARHAATLALIDQDLERLQRRFRNLAQDTRQSPRQRQAWSSLQQLVMTAIGALRSRELIKVGEHQSNYLRIRQEIASDPSPYLSAALADVENAVGDRGDLFSLRYSGLAAKLDAENALFRIRTEVAQVNAYALQKVTDAKLRLQASRERTTTSITFAKAVIVVLTAISMIVAVVSALFVSRYVAANLHRITDVMRRLAAGDLKARLPKKSSSSDEIGQLSEAFRKFRSNALRLERKTREVWRRNELFITVFQNISDGVAVLSPAGQILAENGRVRELLRLEPVRDEHRLTLQDLIGRSAFKRRANENDRAGFGEYADAAGHVLEVRQSPLPDGGSVWLFSETTERKRIDERLEEIRRVESLGKVTGEVAHDFGNILSTISGNLHMLEGELSPKASVLRARINDAVELGVSLIERLLAFARKQHLAPQQTDIAAIAEGMEDLLSMALPETVTLSITCDDGPMFARIDPGQLESAILNLCVNAGQAIHDRGEIEIGVARQADGWVALSVRDDGCGMDADTLRQAAEPFFTARADGEGTGLGLSMVHGFVHQSGGSIRIVSDPGQGTCVTLLFPEQTGTCDVQPRADGRKPALVVDDDVRSAEAITRLVEDFGYSAVTVHSFREALAQLRSDRSLSVVITDLQLDDGNSGWSVVQEALETHRRCRVVAISGHLPEKDPVAAGFRDRFAKLPKPVTAEALRGPLGHGTGSPA
ncbi:ATP-binding protein [Labrenzia sp. 011]|uniref:ATP-binding protein n=1 Tax=Labrenzia sp. 011 TaxID=2171494 RepID=UPI000D50B989|nr:ATP-binding protein [Labrenzia sp. 011]PVB60550.1 hybrid sensor histidine kinase/response regulator [Labrenzia sp. 011]